MTGKDTISALDFIRHMDNLTRTNHFTNKSAYNNFTNGLRGDNTFRSTQLNADISNLKTRIDLLIDVIYLH